MSITAVLDLIRRVEQADRPARIFYVSDFDPAGYGMPISVARKIEFLIDQLELDMDIRLEPIALTQAQVVQHQLPRTPIKDTELRRGNFEAIHGQGAVELDALEALYPGTLRDIVREYLDRYYDHDIDAELRRGLRELEAELSQAVQTAVSQVLEDRPEWEDLKERFYAAVDEFKTAVQPIQDDLNGFMEDLLSLLEKIDDGKIDPKAYFPEDVKQAEEDEDVLFDSRRDYGAQLLAYKLQRAGGNGHGGDL
jgi:hypothetical protein